jgi:transcriptional regulator with XRE-family HTH domain
MTEPDKPQAVPSAESRGTAAMLERIRNRRAALGLNGSELARRAAISPSYVSLIERGYKVPDEEAAARLARALEDDEDLYRAWARAARYGLDRLDEMQRLQTLTSDEQTTTLLASGRDLPALTVAAAAPAAPRSPSGFLARALGAVSPRLRASAPTTPRPAASQPSYAADSEAEEDFALDEMAEEPPARDVVVEVPVLPAGTDPRRVLDATALHPLHLDARLLGTSEGAGLFAYVLDREASARLGGIASAGDYVVLSRRLRRLGAERVYAVRGEDERIRLGRVLFKGSSLLLLPATGSDIEVVPLREGEPWRERVLGVVVLTLKRWG